LRKIDLKTWNRREHFEFFSKFDEPFFGIVSEVDCSRDFAGEKTQDTSFFARYLHKSLLAVNDVDEFRYRIVDGSVIEYNEIHASSTIGRSDGTFGYSFVKFNRDFNVFNKTLQKEITRVQNSTGLCLSAETTRQDTIHFSSIPWKKFTGLTHARDYKRTDSVPKISFGKAYADNDKTLMSVAVYGHHGLMDGLHISQFLDQFQNHLDEG